MFEPVDPKVDFPRQEEKILAFWEKNGIFEKSIRQREKGKAEEYVFYDGPPFATGLPHFGHFVPSTIKDIIPRYQTMKGRRVERRFGWDCHGLPVENLIEKELGLNSKTDIEKNTVWISLMKPAALPFSGMSRNGAPGLPALAAGLILTATIRRWIRHIWNPFGGSSNGCGKKA